MIEAEAPLGQLLARGAFPPKDDPLWKQMEEDFVAEKCPGQRKMRWESHESRRQRFLRQLGRLGRPVGLLRVVGTVAASSALGLVVAFAWVWMSDRRIGSEFVRHYLAVAPMWAIALPVAELVRIRRERIQFESTVRAYLAGQRGA